MKALTPEEIELTKKQRVLERRKDRLADREDEMAALRGEWEQFDSASSDEVLDHFTMIRPLEGSTAIVSTSRNIGGGQWTGLAWPDSDKRIWRWTKADGNGTTHEFTGKRIDGGGMLFEGRDFSPAGPNVNVRLTFTLGKDGRVLEKAEVSQDGGKTWRLHHEAWYRKKSMSAQTK